MLYGVMLYGVLHKVLWLVHRPHFLSHGRFRCDRFESRIYIRAVGDADFNASC